MEEKRCAIDLYSIIFICECNDWPELEDPIYGLEIYFLKKSDYLTIWFSSKEKRDKAFEVINSGRGEDWKDTLFELEGVTSYYF